jgi:hypothetical protein
VLGDDAARRVAEQRRRLSVAVGLAPQPMDLHPRPERLPGKICRLGPSPKLVEREVITFHPGA